MNIPVRICPPGCTYLHKRPSVPTCQNGGLGLVTYHKNGEHQVSNDLFLATRGLRCGTIQPPFFSSAVVYVADQHDRHVRDGLAYDWHDRFYVGRPSCLVLPCLVCCRSVGGPVVWSWSHLYAQKEVILGPVVVLRIAPPNLKEKLGSFYGA